MDEATRPLQCEIRVRGHLSATLLTAFPGMEATLRAGETLLTGALPDQAALFGVLAQVEALGLELLEVRRERASTGKETQVADERSATQAQGERHG